MSVDEQEINPNWTQPPAKTGMSTNTKVLIGLGAGCGVVVALCCGGFMFFGYFFKSYVEDAVNSDPAAVEALTGEITQIDIPDRLQPNVSIDIKVPFTEQRFMRWAMYQDSASNSFLVLAEMGNALDGQDREQVQGEISKSLREQGQNREDIEVQESHQKKFEIRGQEATFNFVRGKGIQSETERLQVTGTFQGKGGPAMLIFDAEADQFSEEEIVEIIESIR